ncbi:MAG TPA: LysM peptidoglycan-binding domain-containing protein, partial [Anaerolineales bacterium]|nr:LysM peptidoglycan-binding domain-containing protein [Anaerolineales bacterium]
MTRKTKILLAAGILTLVCGMAVAGVLLGVVSIPPIGEQLPEGANRASVTIVYPAAGGTWPLNSYVPIRVMARAAQPIASVDVFINNTPLEPRKGVVSTWAGQWDWQPGVAGDFVLTARVTTQAGAVSLSEPVRIHVGEAAAGMTMARAEGGETLADIAAAQGVSPEALQAGNPNTDLSAQLEPGQAIFVPDAPAPVESAQLIEPLPESQAAGPAAEGEAQDAEPGGGGEGSPAGNSANFLNDLNFMLKSSEQNQEPAAGDSSTAGKDPASVPQAPQLEGDFSGCDVKLRIGGWYYDPIDPLVIKRDEDGFFVYRSRDGGAFERIQTVAPIHDSKDDKNRELVYANEYGELTYYASAFNVLGESASNPITLPLSSFNCKAPS